MFLELLCVSVVWLYVDNNMYSDFHYCLHQDPHWPLPSTNKSARPFSPVTRQPNGSSTEHCPIQKDPVSFAFDTAHITGLLYSVLRGDRFSNVYWFNSTSGLGMAIHNLGCVPQFILEPVSLLLEDRRSAASGERCNQTNLLLLVKLDAINNGLRDWSRLRKVLGICENKC